MPVHEHIDVDGTDVIAVKGNRVTPEIVMAKGATQFAQVPAQRGHRIRCVLEQERRQLLAVDAVWTEHEVCQDAPRLVAAQRRERLSGPENLWHAEEMKL